MKKIILITSIHFFTILFLIIANFGFYVVADGIIQVNSIYSNYDKNNTTNSYPSIFSLSHRSLIDDGLVNLSDNVFLNNSSQNISTNQIEFMEQNPPYDYEICLKPGWNFISTPAPLKSGSNTFDIFKTLDTGSRSMYQYNPTTGWNLIHQNELFEPFHGIWIYSTNETRIPLYFDSSIKDYSGVSFLKMGWNSIGFPLKTPLLIDEGLSSVNDKWLFLVPFNSTSQQMESPVIKGWSYENSQNRYLKPGLGYWLYMNTDGYLSGPIIQPNKPLSGTVNFSTKNENGWTFTIPGTINGSYHSDSGSIHLESSDAYVSYAGKKYPIQMNIHAFMN